MTARQRCCCCLPRLGLHTNNSFLSANVSVSGDISCPHQSIFWTESLVWLCDGEGGYCLEVAYQLITLLAS